MKKLFDILDIPDNSEYNISSEDERAGLYVGSQYDENAPYEHLCDWGTVDFARQLDRIHQLPNTFMGKDKIYLKGKK